VCATVRAIGEDFTVGFSKQPRLTVTGTSCGQEPLHKIPDAFKDLK